MISLSTLIKCFERDNHRTPIPDEVKILREWVSYQKDDHILGMLTMLEGNKIGCSIINDKMAFWPKKHPKEYMGSANPDSVDPDDLRVYSPPDE